MKYKFFILLNNLLIVDDMVHVSDVKNIFLAYLEAKK